MEKSVDLHFLQRCLFEFVYVVFLHLGQAVKVTLVDLCIRNASTQIEAIVRRMFILCCNIPRFSTATLDFFHYEQ